MEFVVFLLGMHGFVVIVIVFFWSTEEISLVIVIVRIKKWSL